MSMALSMEGKKADIFNAYTQIGIEKLLNSHFSTKKRYRVI